MKKLVVIGAGGHGKVVADIAKACEYEEIIFLDDSDTTCAIGKVCDYGHYMEEYGFIVAIGNSKVREKLQNKLLENGCQIVTLIHPNAIVGSNVSIGIGTVVMAGTVINTGTKIGNGVIVNTSSSVDHDNVVRDYCHISVGAHLAGTVSIGKHTWIGAGAIVSNNISICEECMIGAGAVVVKNIEDRGTYIGVPARKI